MEFLDARRLTGPNLLWDRAGSILDVRCTPEEADAVIRSWQQAVRPMLDAVGWGREQTVHRRLAGGVSLAFSAPIDALYAASEINEWAWTVLESRAAGRQPPDFQAALARIRAAIEAERNPDLLSLARAARERSVAFLWDDDFASVGLGRGSETWAAREVPDPAVLDWQRYHDVPVGIVTGTNGKTTTARLATHILKAGGRRVGVSCTEWIAVNDRIIDRGDWSGPGGARRVLRETDVDVAVLETARGGLLRRGLGVERADAALITNIAEDHLGDFGSRSLAELLDVKWVVSHAVRESGVLILNADDDRLRARARAYEGRLVWFSVERDNAVVRDHVAAGGLAFVLDSERLTLLEGGRREAILDGAEIPIALEGAARHNLANALAAAALSHALGATLEDVRKGLATMSQADNPGRSNVYERDGVRVLVDFAHNPQAMRAVFGMARALPARRRLLAFGQAGDRPDDLIRELAHGAWDIGLDRVVVSELPDYYRGREPGEVYAVIRDELLRLGARAEQIGHYDQEIDALEDALAWAEPGDLVIMIALADSPTIRERLEAPAGA